MSDLVLHHLPPSPNNLKVRLALGLKRIPARFQAVDPTDRALVVRISGQPLTPVLVDRDRVVYDSYAILRYLDANWPTEPRLYSSDYQRQKAIEAWELFARTQIGECVSLGFGQFFAREKDPTRLERARELLAERLPKVEEALAQEEYLMGAAPNAADLSTAAALSLFDLEAGSGPPGSPVRFFSENFRFPAGFDRTRRWLAKLLQHDPLRD